jgi:hypothetical protein
MKTTLYPIVLMAYAVATSQSGEFVNLTFDEPDLSHARYRDYPPGLVAPLQDVFRGWSIQWDWTGEPKPGPECVGVHGGDIPLGLVAMGTAPYGSYLVLVSEFWAEYGGQLRPTLHLWQTGTVPDGASELTLYQSGLGGGGARPVETYINGQIQYQVGAPGVPAFSAIDVSAFAGQEVKLEFVFPSGPAQYHSFDIFGFVTVPEPSVLVLLAGGGFVLWLARPRGLGAGRGG